MEVMQKYKIMIVEDEPDIMELMSAALAGPEYLIALAENGKEAVEKLPLFNPDVLVLDIVMPVMDGWEVLAFVTGHPVYSRVKVLITSSLILTPEMFTERRLSSHARILSKPFRLSELKSAVRDLLEEKSGERSRAA